MSNPHHMAISAQRLAKHPISMTVALREQLKPSFHAVCVCGLRYGMHRVNDYACPNQEWRPGNGQPQWLESNWRRA